MSLVSHIHQYERSHCWWSAAVWSQNSRSSDRVCPQLPVRNIWCETHETSPPNVKERAIGAGGGSNSRVGQLRLRNLQLIDFRIFLEAGSAGEVRVDRGTGYLWNQRNSFVLKYILLVSESGQTRPPGRCLDVYTSLGPQQPPELAVIKVKLFCEEFLINKIATLFNVREPKSTPYIPHWYTI